VTGEGRQVSKRFASAAAIAAAFALVPATAASAQDNDGSPNDPRAKAFVREVSVDRVERHQQRLQEIADANEGTRVVFGGGYTDSVDYVVRVLERAGYEPEVTPFNYPFWEETQPPVLNQVTPTAKTYRPGTAAQSGTADVDFITFPGSPTVSLDNVAVVPAGGIQIPPGGPPPAASQSGCQAADYPAAVRGAVALVQRGTCPFVQKWQLAQDAGAVGVIIFNEGNTSTRMNAQYVETGFEGTIPALFGSFALGQELYNAYQAGQNPTVDLQTYGVLRDRFFDQVIAETDGGDPNNVVVVGAHLDSVAAGPGINDDGSGTALLLTMAQRLARPGHPLRQKIRFGWWGGEEEGLIGSSYYADNLSEEEVSKIDVMLDYDMLSSPNYARLVYDGDGSDNGPNGQPNPAGPEGSGTVEEVFREWFSSKRQPVWAIPFDGRSDYVGFTDRGIPAGGIFAGAEGVKTAAQERLLGGDAGSWYDPCYHQACDDITTVLSGVPPLDATGLAVDVPEADRTDADKALAAQKMRGGARKSMVELGAAATYATWYFASVNDPFGTGARTASIARKQASKQAKLRARTFRPKYAGHLRLGR
jgi:Zn-dependent M28 family amino/carboxypeptidase